MTLKAPINAGHMVPNAMEIFIAKRWSDPLMQVGYYKDQDLATAGETSDDVYSNGSLKKIKDWNKVKVSFSLHELTNEKLEILQLGLISMKAGTVVGEVENFMPGSWSFDKDILLKYSNQDGTPADVTKVEALINGVVKPLTKGTDYEVIVTSLGATAIKLKKGTLLTDTAPVNVKLTVTYSATANDVKVVEHKANSLAKGFVMVLVNEFEYDGKKKSIKLYVEDCQASKALMKQIADNDGTTAWIPVEITGTIVKQDNLGFSLA